MQGNEPVEIELTPTDPRRSKQPRADRRLPESAPDADRSDTAGAAEDAHRTDAYSQRALVTIVGVGVVALVLGWVIGRAGGNEPDALASVADTTDASVETPPALAGEAVPAVEESTAASTDTPRRATTTTLVVESRTIEVDPAFAGVSYEVVGTHWGGELVVLDLTNGELVIRHDLDTTRGGPPVLWAGDGWVIIPDWSTGDSWLVEDGDDPVRLAVDAWAMMASETPGQFWTLDHDARNGFITGAQLVDRFGAPVGEPIELSEPARFPDPTGGLLLEVAGSTYRVDGEGATKIVDGSVLALDDERVVARTCDGRLQCDYVVVDRATGESRPLPLDRAIRFEPLFWPASDATIIAPDGHTMAATWIDRNRAPALGLVDLDTGTLTVLSDESDGMVRWSPDGRFAFYLESGYQGSGDLMAHEIATGESFVVAVDLPRLSAVAIRPRG